MILICENHNLWKMFAMKTICIVKNNVLSYVWIKSILHKYIILNKQLLKSSHIHTASWINHENASVYILIKSSTRYMLFSFAIPLWKYLLCISNDLSSPKFTIRLLCETHDLGCNLFISTLTCVQNKTITKNQKYKTTSGDVYYYSSGGVTDPFDSQLL